MPQPSGSPPSRRLSGQQPLPIPRVLSHTKEQNGLTVHRLRIPVPPAGALVRPAGAVIPVEVVPVTSDSRTVCSAGAYCDGTIGDTLLTPDSANPPFRNYRKQPLTTISNAIRGCFFHFLFFYISTLSSHFTASEVRRIIFTVPVRRSLPSSAEISRVPPG